MASKSPTSLICSVGEIAAPIRNALVGGPFGSDLVSADYVTSGVPVIRGQNLNNGKYVDGEFVFVSEQKADRLSANLARPGDLVFTQRGNAVLNGGQVAIVPDGTFDRYVVSQSQMKLTPDGTKTDPQYLYSIFTSAEYRQYLRNNAIVTGVPHINLGLLRDFRFSLPPLREQKAIAQILGSLDDKIELNRRMNATLEAMAQTLFKSCFVDFDPIRAKLDGRKPSGLDDATAALFPSALEPSPLGPIPQGWTAKALSEAIEVNPRRVLKAGVVAPYLDMKNLPTQGHCAGQVVERAFTSGTRFQNGDTLLARITPCLENGKTGFVDFLPDGQVGWGSTEYVVLAPKPPLPPQFAYFLARSEALRSHAIQNMTGSSGRQRVDPDCFDVFLLAVPPPRVAQRFDELTAPLMARIRAGFHEARTLASLRDTLLPKLLSRELKVPLTGFVDTEPLTLSTTPTVASEKKAPAEFVEAIVIAQLVRKLSDSNHPLGRKRYNKLAYLAHRKAEDDVTQQYLKKAAGPYSPWARYAGPEKIAEKNGYVRRVKVGVYDGFVTGPNINQIDNYVSRYPVCAAIERITEQFRYTKNGELELLAMVDFAALDLLRAGQRVTSAAIEQVIASNFEWAPKLNRATFSRKNIDRALQQLSALFPATYAPSR